MMSGFVRRSRRVALGLLGAAALSGPALADASTSPPADPCTQWSRSLGAGPACRPAPRVARRGHGIRTAMAEFRRQPLGFDGVPIRYTGFLILGVGF